MFSIRPLFLSETAPIGYKLSSDANTFVAESIVKFLTTPDAVIS